MISFSCMYGNSGGKGSYGTGSSLRGLLFINLSDKNGKKVIKIYSKFIKKIIKNQSNFNSLLKQTLHWNVKLITVIYYYFIRK